MKEPSLLPHIVARRRPGLLILLASAAALHLLHPGLGGSQPAGDQKKAGPVPLVTRVSPAEATGAVSPAVEGATTPAPDAPEAMAAEQTADREPAAKHTE